MPSSTQTHPSLYGFPISRGSSFFLGFQPEPLLELLPSLLTSFSRWFSTQLSARSRLPSLLARTPTSSSWSATEAPTLSDQVTSPTCLSRALHSSSPDLCLPGVFLFCFLATEVLAHFVTSSDNSGHPHQSGPSRLLSLL